MAAVPYQNPVETLGPHGAYPAFGVRVRFRCLRRGLENLYACASEYAVEGGRELPVAISDQKAEPTGVLVEVHQRIPGGLGHPCAGRMGGDPGRVHPAVREFDDEEHVQPSQADRFDGQEITGERSGGLRAQKLRPGRPAAPWRRSQAVAPRTVRTEVAETRTPSLRHSPTMRR
jgi:hypothetical protein